MPKRLFATFLSLLFTLCLSAQDSTNFPTLGQIKQHHPDLAKLIDHNTPIQVITSGYVWTEGPAWNKEGLLFVLNVTGKKQSPWCRPTRMEDSDGLQLWIDTRDSHTVHRANRFCHRFQFLPFGGGHRLDEPIAAHSDIWEKVVRQIDARQMPPIGEERPDDAGDKKTVRIKDVWKPIH